MRQPPVTVLLLQCLLSWAVSPRQGSSVSPFTSVTSPHAAVLPRYPWLLCDCLLTEPALCCHLKLAMPPFMGSVTVTWPMCVTSNNNNHHHHHNHNRIERRNWRFFTIYSRRELSPTCTLKWPGRTVCKSHATH